MLTRSDTLWPWPLTPWHWTCIVDAASCDQSMFQIWARSVQPQLSYWRLTTDFRPFSGVLQYCGSCFKNAWTDLHQPLWEYCHLIFAHQVLLENVSIAKALQLEAARRRAVPIRFNMSPVASLKSLSLSVAVLERIYCLYVTLRCDLELWPHDLDLWPLTLNICSLPAVP